MTSGGTIGYGSLLKLGDGGVGAAVAASKNWGTTTASIRIKANPAGAAGNNRTVQVLVSGSSYVKTKLTATRIDVTAPTTAKVSEVIAWLMQDEVFIANWRADYNGVGDGTGTITQQTTAYLTGGSDGSEVFSTIPEAALTSIFDSSMNPVECTNLDSADAVREFLAGLIDAGALGFRVNFLPANSVHVALQTAYWARTKKNFHLVLSDAAQTTFLLTGALITNFGLGGETESVLTATLNLKLSAKPTQL